MKAIVYMSNTGFTESYARLLSDNISLPYYSVEQAEKKLSKNDEIIYMGWVCNGSIKGLKQAESLFSVRAVCAVGLSAADEDTVKHLISQNCILDTPTFYLRGGFDLSKLRGKYKLMMKLYSIKNSLPSDKDSEKDKNELIESMKNDADYVREFNLRDIIVWYYRNKQPVNV